MHVCGLGCTSEFFPRYLISAVTWCQHWLHIQLQASFAELKNLLDMAQHIAPAAFPAVLGTRADESSQRKVDISDVLVRCG